MNSDYFKTTLHGNYNQLNHVLVIEDENYRKTLILEEANYSIGRDETNTIVLHSKKVSRFHATLLRRTDATNRSFSYWLLDGDLQGNRSTNGIFINDKRCLVQELKHEDIVRLGLEVQMSYYVLDNVADVALLQSGDFHNPSESESKIPSNTKINPVLQNKESIVVSEANLEASKNESTDNSNVKKLASFPQLSPYPIFELDWRGKVTYLNPIATKWFPELKKDNSPNNHPLLINLTNNLQTNGKSHKLFSREVKFKNKILEQYVHYLPEQELIRSYIFDRTKAKSSSNVLAHGDAKYQNLLNQTQEGILIVDAQTKDIVDANCAVNDLLGYTVDEVCSLKLYDLIDLKTAALDKQINSIVQNNKNNYLLKQFSYRCKNRVFVDLESSIGCFVSNNQTLVSILIRPLQKKNYQETYIQEEGLYNLETGLPNRQFLMEQLKMAIANSFRNQELLCLVFLELEILEEDGDNLDYKIRSRILEGFAKRLKACLRLGDTIGYWESSQFGCLFPKIKTSRDVGRVCNRMLESLKQPFFLDDKKVYTKISIGITLKGKEEKTIDTLITEAQNALVKSKQAGSNNYRFSEEKLQSETERLLRIEKLLANALERKEFSLFYQPQIDVEENEITGIEALIRWQHPDLGIVSPDQFIPLAEETGLIVSIGEWVIEKACQQRKTWQEHKLTDQPICINISSGQFQQPNFVNFLKNILDKTQLNPHLLELEIKETTLAIDLELSKQYLTEIHAMGIRIALDNFGKGVSSFGYLKDFQFSTLKIDPSIINDFTANPQDKAIIHAILNIAQSFDLRVVAEGVEKQATVDSLLELGCQEIQGNLLNTPLTEDNMTNFLRESDYSL